MSLCNSPLGESIHSGGNRLKRLVDLVLALVTLPLTLPIMLVIALAIRMTSSGPVLMRLSCIGMNGRVFRQYRFRVIRGDLSAADLLGRADNAACLTPLA
ncbi:sugar transferase, partial [Pseudogemmobacter bohemicus]|uniref:sugar transferase n=1 Tax=Pseudogemmobacter bohemicus TaxID=2250708 RepID=UPI0018E582BC